LEGIYTFAVLAALVVLKAGECAAVSDGYEEVVFAVVMGAKVSCSFVNQVLAFLNLVVAHLDRIGGLAENVEFFLRANDDAVEVFADHARRIEVLGEADGGEIDPVGAGRLLQKRGRETPAGWNRDVAGDADVLDALAGGIERHVIPNKAGEVGREA